MPQIKKASCTRHILKLCPENKYIVKLIKAEIETRKDQSNISDAVNNIIEQFGKWKGIKV